MTAKLAPTYSTIRQLQMSDYTEAWEPGHSLRTLAPRHLRIAARSAAARTMLHMHPISYRSKDPSALTLSPGRVLWQGDVIDVALQPCKLCHAQERVPPAYPSPNPDLTPACATSRAHDECAHFCLWTGWATQRVSIPTELSFTRYRANPPALILLACSSVVKSAPLRLLGQGRGCGNVAR